MGGTLADWTVGGTLADWGIIHSSRESELSIIITMPESLLEPNLGSIWCSLS